MNSSKPKFSIETPPEHAAELIGAVTLDDEKKADVLIALIGVFHSNIVSWATRSYEVATWALGAEYAVVSYFYVRDAKLDIISTIVLLLGLFSFGTMTQFYLRAAGRAHFGNRLAISKCEAALGLYRPNEYFIQRAFFAYSPKMLRSTNLGVIRVLHTAGTALAIGLLWLVHIMK